MSNEICTPLHDKDRALDWLTALSPVWLMGCLYFRWWALFLPVVTVAGYLIASLLFQRLGVLSVSAPAAAFTGLLIALCLPSTTPVWVGAMAGMVAAAAATLPTLLGRWWKDAPALLHPALVGYLAVRLIFSAETTAFPMPAMWAADAVSGATPLASLGEALTSEGAVRLFLGVHPAAIGEGCAPVILLAALYLLLRRRLRLIAPAVMLGSVALLSWLVWGNPLGGLLSGGVLLGALLLADRAFAPEHYGQQTLAGLVAAALIVILRATAMVDGTAVGVLAAGVLLPAYPYMVRFICWSSVHVWRFIRWASAHVWRLTCMAAVWLWRQIRRYAPVVWAFLVTLVMQWIPTFARRFVGYIRDILQKTQK